MTSSTRRCVMFLAVCATALVCASAFVPTFPAAGHSYPSGLVRQLGYEKPPTLSARRRFRNIFSRNNKDGNASNNQDGDDEDDDVDVARSKPKSSSLFPIHEWKDGKDHGQPKAAAKATAKSGSNRTVVKSEVEQPKIENKNKTQTAINVTNVSDSKEPVEPKPRAVTKPIVPTKAVVAKPSVSSDDINGNAPALRSSSNVKSSNSIVAKLDDIGESFHRRAQRATADKYQKNTKTKKFLCSLKIYAYYMLYLDYHVAKGALTLLPPVFRQVYRKMESAVDDCNRGLLQAEGTTGGTSVKTKLQRQRESTTDDDDAALEMGSAYIKWTTRLTVLIVSTAVTSSYALGGVVHVVTRFARALSRSRSLTTSFEAAADQAMINEERWNGILQAVNGVPE